MLGGLASVAGGARNHAELLTGSRVAQWGWTPLHYAASIGHEAAIKALVAAKADVDATDEVRVGDG
jgi:ankyrin repeat protein